MRSRDTECFRRTRDAGRVNAFEGHGRRTCECDRSTLNAFFVSNADPKAFAELGGVWHPPLFAECPRGHSANWGGAWHTFFPVATECLPKNVPHTPLFGECFCFFNKIQLDLGPRFCRILAVTNVVEIATASRVQVSARVDQSSPLCFWAWCLGLPRCAS